MKKRQFGRHAAIFLAIFLLAGLFSPLASAETETLNVTLGGVALNKTIYPGTDNIILTLTVNNPGEALEDASVVLQASGSAMVVKTVGAKIIDLPKNGSATAEFTVQATTVASGRQDLTATVSHGGKTKDLAVSLLVAEVPQIPDEPDPVSSPLVLESFVSRQDPIVAGERVTFDFTVASPEWQATTGKVLVSVYVSDGIMLPAGQTNTVELAAVSRSKPGKGSISFDVRDGIETQMCQFVIKIEYIDAYGQGQTVSAERTLKISGRENTDRVRISGFNVAGGLIVPGQKFSASLSVENLGTEALSSLTLSVKNLSAQGISPVGDGGVVAISGLNPSQTKNATFSLFAAAGLPSGVTEVEISGVYTTQSGAQGTFSATFYATVSAPSVTLPGLRIVSAEAKGAQVGQKVNLIVVVENTGSAKAEQVAVVVSGMSTSGAMLQGTLDTFSAGTIEAGAQKTVTVPLQIGSGASGYVTLSLALAHANGKEEEKNIYLPVTGGTGGTTLGSLMLTGLSVAGSVVPGNEFTLTYTLKNIGTAPLSSLRISFEGGNFVPASGLNLFTEQTLAPNASVTKTVRMAAAPNIGEGMASIALAVEHTGGTETLDGFLKIAKSESGDDSLPRLMIESYTLDPEDVLAGGRFLFTFRLVNTSKTTAVGNIKLTLSSAEGIFTPVAGSNTFYTEIIAPGASAEYSIELSAKSQAEQKSYPIQIGIDYEYGDGGRFSGAEEINVYVTQPIRLEFTNIFYPTSVMMGEQPYISLQYYNKGKSALNNLTILAEGDIALAEGEQFIGNLPAGSGTYFEGSLILMNIGTVNGTLVFAFEDAAGQPQRMELPLSVEVFESGEPVGPIDPDPWIPVDPEPEPGDGFVLAWYIWALIGLAGAAVITVVVVVLVRRRKKFAAAEEDWDA